MFCDVENYGYNEQKAEFAVNTSYCTVKVSTNPMAYCDNTAHKCNQEEYSQKCMFVSAITGWRIKFSLAGFMKANMPEYSTYKQCPHYYMRPYPDICSGWIDFQLYGRREYSDGQKQQWPVA